jgi:hypothetical protein
LRRSPPRRSLCADPATSSGPGGAPCASGCLQADRRSRLRALDFGRRTRRFQYRQCSRLSSRLQRPQTSTPPTEPSPARKTVIPERMRGSVWWRILIPGTSVRAFSCPVPLILKASRRYLETTPPAHIRDFLDRCSPYYHVDCSEEYLSYMRSGLEYSPTGDDTNLGFLHRRFLKR